MADLCLRAADRGGHLELAVAVTSDLVREAQQIHTLGSTSAIALGRLLTGVSLLSLTRKSEGSTSIQVLSKGRMGTLYADCTHEGHVRGMAKNPGLSFPLIPGESLDGRCSIKAAVYPGKISVVRRVLKDYAQSSTLLTTGEIDEDLESFIVGSDQIPTVAVCDVLLDRQRKVTHAGGVLIQALPDGDLERLEHFKEQLAGGVFAEALREVADPADLLQKLAPNAELIDSVPLSYRCRCSSERVMASLRMFSPTDLAEMADEGKVVEVNCDLCGKRYPVAPEELHKAFLELVKAEG